MLKLIKATIAALAVLTVVVAPYAQALVQTPQHIQQSPRLQAALRASAVPAVRPQILRVIPHDTTAFTQGLIIIDTLLYESTGIVGQSSLRRVSPTTGRVLHRIPVPDVFAEGITVLGSELVQLTWKDEFALRYEFPSLRPKSVMHTYQGQGWGLTNDGTNFIMSNGSDTLYWRNADFQIIRKLPVTYASERLIYLNELQYVRGRVYANVWYENFIAEISIDDGRVIRTIDCSELVAIERPSSANNVLNGIAYCERNNEWYLTGKNWRNMFIVRIPQ
ncbi:MAG: glutaminyl-peptide cyclotransferase [Chitinispirillales bacterium]|jgi:glutamine cyclotransferase|nr:glutaminyl-peptide cyclotransferase [Chitinispirillales bacterium]